MASESKTKQPQNPTKESNWKPVASDPQSYRSQGDCTESEGRVITPLPERRGDFKAPLHYGRNTLILGHILAVLPLGLSVFSHFTAICTKISESYGDCTGTNVAAGFFLD